MFGLTKVSVFEIINVFKCSILLHRPDVMALEKHEKGALKVTMVVFIWNI